MRISLFTYQLSDVCSMWVTMDYDFVRPSSHIALDDEHLRGLMWDATRMLWKDVPA